MSRTIFSAVCDHCFNAAFKNAVQKLFVQQNLKDVSQIDSDFLAENSFMFMMFISSTLITKADQMHRDCVLACVRDEDFCLSFDFDPPKIFSTDLEILHAFCTAHPHKKSEMLEGLTNSASMSIDIYRYLEQNDILVKRQHVKREIVINSLSGGNMELADYVSQEIDSIDNAFISDLLVVKDGASVLQNIGSRMDIKNQVVDELNNLNPGDTVGDYFDTNVKELLDKNFICGSEICYKI
jgi:hypothetical protein